MNARIAPHLGIVIGCLLLAAVVPMARAADAPADVARRQFRAGAATSNITPMLGGAIVGNFTTPPAMRIHDELHARCLVLDDGTTRLAFVVCDNVGIPREVFDDARKQIAEATGIPPHHLLMSATHTHSATSARSENALVKADTLNDYQSFLARRISDGVRRAISNLEPAKIGWGSAVEPRPLFNRRYHMKPGVELLNPIGGTDSVKMNPGVANANVVGPAGPTDPQVSFITVQSLDGRPICLLANYSLHYVGGVRANEISADYFAVFADKVQQKLGADRVDPPFVGILCNGTSGDVNNVNVMGPKLPAKKPYEQMHAVAEMVAEAVIAVHKDVKLHDWVPLYATTREMTLKTRKPSAEQIARSKQIVSGEVQPKVPLEPAYAERMLQLAKSPDEVTVVLQALRIGDLGVAAIPFEVFTQSGLDIKSKSSLQPSFTVSLANGSYGYLPTEAQHKLGGYETWLGTCRVEEQSATRIVAALLEMLKELKDAKPKSP